MVSRYGGLVGHSGAENKCTCPDIIQSKLPNMKEMAIIFLQMYLGIAKYLA